MARSITVANDIITSGNVTLASSGTIALWAKPIFAPGDGTQRYFFNSGAGDAPAMQRFTDNNFYVGFANAGNTRVIVADAGLFSAGVWANFALTWTPSLQTFLINGVSKGTQAFTFSSPGAQTLLVGGNGGTHVFDGSEADFGVWSVVLSAGELIALSKGARPNTIRPASLKPYYPLDGIASPEPDLSGSANNGTVTGTSLASGPPVMMLTPRWTQVTQAGTSAATVAFRRSLSALGTRAGSRQVHGGL